MPPSSDAGQHWHLDKRLNVSHLLTTVVLVAGLFTWGSGIEKNIERNATEIRHSREIQHIQTEQFNRSIEEIKDQGKVINEKLDSLMERQNDK